MHTQPTAAVVPPLCDTDRRITELHADLHACRLAILRSLSRDPDDVDGREPLWVEFFRLKRAVRNTLDRIADALAALDEPDDDGRSVVKLRVERADGSEALVSCARLFPYLGAVEPGVIRGDAMAGIAMPPRERDRLPHLSS